MAAKSGSETGAHKVLRLVRNHEAEHEEPVPSQQRPIKDSACLRGNCDSFSKMVPIAVIFIELIVFI